MELKTDLPSVFEEFEESRRNGFLEAKKAKDAGQPLVGVYCTFFPTELAMAMDIQTVSLCAFSNETVPDAEASLPANLCPLIKSSYGFARTQKCPYFYFSDLIVGETTCDGKKKMYELLAKEKDVYVMELPNCASEGGRRLWISEIRRLKDYLETKFGRTLSEKRLWEAIRQKNEERSAMNRFSRLMALDPPPMRSSELYHVLYGSSYEFDKIGFPEKIDALIARVLGEYHPDSLKRKPRILITGCPIGGDTEKVTEAVEANGGIVVAFENCGGAKPLAALTDTVAADPYEALADRYLGIGCSCMSPNPNRFRLLDTMIDEYKADGILDVVLHACLTYSIESRKIQRFCTDTKGLPYLAVETDYSPSDIGQLNTRIGAFVELLRGRKDQDASH